MRINGSLEQERQNFIYGLKNENGETEIILINYGEAAVIRMPDGEEIEIPAGGLTRYTVNKEKTIL